ncbi:hypothetical protein Ancab_026376, partial [Ancistrocladus abbreviatus]
PFPSLGRPIRPRAHRAQDSLQGEVPRLVQDIGRDSLYYLNLSHNSLTGGLELLSWKNLQYIDIHSNMLQGPILVPLLCTIVLLASDNRFTGEIPLSMCNLTSLQLVNPSNNSLSGKIPQCMNFNGSLPVFDLGSKKLQGIIPSAFGMCSSLMTLDLNGNYLEGQLPLSLHSCEDLEVLDVGNNKLNDTFPYWLGPGVVLKQLPWSHRKFRSRSYVSPATNYGPFPQQFYWSLAKYTSQELSSHDEC